MPLTIASNVDESEAAERIVGHHRAMLDSARVAVEAIQLAAIESTDPVPARDELVHWCRDELLPHALAEEEILYAAARPMAPHLIEALIAEHGVLADLIVELSDRSAPVRIASASRSLLSVLQSHVDKENDYVVPLLAADADTSLATLLKSMHEHQGPVPATAGSGCTCDEHDEPGFPVLDARAVPHAIRHATVFGALDAIELGQGLTLIAPHDPLPMLAQLERRSPQAFSVSYLQRGPEAWRLAIVRAEPA